MDSGGGLVGSAVRILAMGAVLSLTPDGWSGQPVSDSLVHGVRLPVAARALRAAGIPSEEVQVLLSTCQQQGLSSGEATLLLEEVSKKVRVKGTTDTLVADVGTWLASGKRGPDLADALWGRQEETPAADAVKLAGSHTAGAGP